jgi:hypothetical protein
VTPDEYSILQRLADVPRGIAKTLMTAYCGFTDESIVGLVRAGFATVKPGTAGIDEQTFEVGFVMITDAGRQALG